MGTGLEAEQIRKMIQPAGPGSHHVVAYDFGLKRNILRKLVDHGCRVTVVPGDTPAAEVLGDAT